MKNLKAFPASIHGVWVHDDDDRIDSVIITGTGIRYVEYRRHKIQLHEVDSLEDIELKGDVMTYKGRRIHFELKKDEIHYLVPDVMAFNLSDSVRFRECGGFMFLNLREEAGRNSRIPLWEVVLMTRDTKSVVVRRLDKEEKLPAGMEFIASERTEDDEKAYTGALKKPYWSGQLSCEAWQGLVRSGTYADTLTVLHDSSRVYITDLHLEGNGRLTWQTLAEPASARFVVEQFKWNKWLEIGKVDGKGAGNNHYEFGVVMHSGRNQARIKTMTGGTTLVSGKATARDSSDQVQPEVPIKVKDKITFKQVRQYEIYDSYGGSIMKGQARVVDVKDLPSGIYYIRYDEVMGEFIKK